MSFSVSANVHTFMQSADFAAMRVNLSLGNVENTALSSWAGTANITTVGTIVSGTWNGSAVAFANIAPASAASKLLGRGSAGGAGSFEEITIGTGLTMSGTTLSASGSAPALNDVTDVTITAAVKGDLLVYNGAAWVDLAVGSDTQVLTADSAEAAGVKWAAAGGGGGAQNLPIALILDGADAPIPDNQKSNLVRMPAAGNIDSVYITSHADADRAAALATTGNNTITIYKLSAAQWTSNPWQTGSSLYAATLNSLSQKAWTGLTAAVALGDFIYAKLTTSTGEAVLLDITLEFNPS